MEMISSMLTLVAIANQAAAIPASLKIWRTGQTAGWPILFFCIGICGAIGMVFYGLVQENNTIFMINLFSVGMSSYYIITYLIMTSDKSEPIRYLVAASVYLVGLYCVFLTYGPTETAKKLDLLGFASAVIFFVMNATTLLDVVASVKSKTASYDMIMLTVGTLNAFLWIIYGLLVEDPYLYAPSFPFALSGTMKFFLLCIYPASRAEKPKKKAE